jgi:hypothetical protein
MKGITKVIHRGSINSIMSINKYGFLNKKGKIKHGR